MSQYSKEQFFTYYEQAIKSGKLDEFTNELYTFLLKHMIYPHTKKIKNKEKTEWSKEFHNKLKVVFIKDETTSSLPETDNPNFPYLYPFYKSENDRGYYQNMHDGWELGPITREYYEILPDNTKPQLVKRCWYCQNIIKKRFKAPNRQKFCCPPHQKAYDKIRNQDLKKLNTELIYWTNKKERENVQNDPYLIPQRKDMLVKLHNGTTRPLTTKHGKKKKPTYI